MHFRNQPFTFRERLLTVSVICFLLAQYVANSHPWDHIFRIAALIVLIVAVSTSLNPDRSSSGRKDR